MNMFRRLYIKWLVWRGKAVDIGSDSEGPAGLLSNFTPYAFSFRGYHFVSMEGLLQEMQSYINDIYPSINFVYPKEYVEYDSKAHLYNWVFPKGIPFLKEQLAFLQKAHKVDNLIPFARNNADGNEEPYEMACFIIDGKGNNRVMTIWPYGAHECFFQEEYENIRDWFENGRL